MNYINSQAESGSPGKCAEYVRRAVAAGGVKIKLPPPGGNSASACDYGPSPEAAGCKSVYSGSGLTDTVIIPGQQAGDIVVIQPDAGHTHGHIVLLNGSNRGDFIQLSMRRTILLW